MTTRDPIFEVSLDEFRAADSPDLAVAYGGVYTLEDAKSNLLYIGQSMDVPRRIQQHRRAKSGWRTRIASARVFPYADASDRVRLESVLILRHQPPHNQGVNVRKLKSGKWIQARFPSAR